MPAVVANQYSVLDPSAAAFAEHFYWSLACGRSVGDAAREARISVNYSISGEAIDWAVPVLYARNPGERLVAKTTQSVNLAWKTTAISGARRGHERRRELRIGVWDINYVIPKLEQILDRLNEVQDYYGVEVITAPAPMGSWRRIKENDGGMLLDGDEVIERLAGIPAAYGVDGVLCVTGFRLQGVDKNGKVLTDFYLYGDIAEDSISIVSVASFTDSFDPREHSAGRFITNMLVSALNGAPIHPDNRGPQTCPNFFNEDLEPESIFGKLEFCKTCLRKITGDRAALKKLLNAY